MENSFQASKIVTPSGVIDNGFVRIKNGRIEAVDRMAIPSANGIDLGNVTLIPGLVNAHTHLEFSDLRQPLGFPGIRFTDWLMNVIDQRRLTSEHSDPTHSIKSGITESLNSGVIAIGEIASGPESDDCLRGSGVHATIYLERLTRDTDQITGTVFGAKSWAEQTISDLRAEDLIRGLSPHAPYSVHPELLQQLAKIARNSSCPLAMHLAETREEIELLRSQTGDFVEFLRNIDAWYPDSFRTDERPLDYLRLLALAPKVMIVHGNYLSQEEIEFISKNRDSMSIVFCPRTHEYFRHATYPLEDFLAADINVAIGTDSRASNPDLNLFSELKTVAKKFPGLDALDILQMGTINGHFAIGSRSEKFEISPGNGAAAINVVTSDSIEQMFRGDSQCRPLHDYLKVLT